MEVKKEEAAVAFTAKNTAAEEAREFISLSEKQREKKRGRRPCSDTKKTKFRREKSPPRVRGIL